MQGGGNVGGLTEKEGKSQNTRKPVRIKQRKNLCLDWELNPRP